MMNRREFLKFTIAGTGTVLLPTSLMGCATPIVHPVVSRVGISVAKWFVRIMITVAAERVAGSILDYAHSLATDAAENVFDTNKRMEKQGFTQTEGRSVYRLGIYDTYEIGHQDDFNGCMVVYDPDKNPKALIEGPSVVGVALAAEAMRDAGYSSAETANYTFPVGEFQKPSQNAFSYDYSQPYVAYTNLGTLQIGYGVTADHTGKVHVMVANRNAQPVYEGAFDITFS